MLSINYDIVKDEAKEVNIFKMSKHISKKIYN